MSNTILILTWTIRQMWAKVHIKVKMETVNIRTEHTHTEKKSIAMRTWMGGSHIHSVVSRLNFSFSSFFMLFVNESLGSALSLSINISTVNDKKGLHFNAWMGKLDDSIEWLEWNSPVDQFPPRDINGLSFLYGFFSFPLDAIACTYTEVEILIGSQVFGIANFWSV